MRAKMLKTCFRRIWKKIVSDE